MGNGIRKANRDDLQAVEKLVRRAYTPWVSRIGQAPGPMSDDYGASIDAGQVHVVDGVVDGESDIRAVLVLIPEPGVMLLDNVAVDPDAQRSGLGRRLLAFAEQAAREAGCRAIRLYTHEKMTENIALYARLGYVETHRATEKGLKRVYMVKSLA